MKLVKMSIYNFRSIIKASDIELSNYTILIGKNNEGKTNVLSALNIAMNTIYYGDLLYKRENRYDYSRDYPVSKKKDNIRDISPTKIILKMTLSEEEKTNFKKQLGFNNNGELDLEIQYVPSEKGELLFVPKFIVRGKKGKGANTYQKNVLKILKYISLNFKFTYIPAIRTSNNIILIIEDIISQQFIDLNKDVEYKNALNIISQKEGEKLNEIGFKLKDTLVNFLPEIKKTSIEANLDTYRSRRFSLRNWNLMIDDGTLTNINFKGNGVKSLISLALLKEYDYNNDGLVAIEEPESHLHSGAIHQLDKVLRDISNKQKVLITTHNSCFVNKNNITSNLLVSNGQCKPITTLKDLRNELGILVSETLVTTDYMVVVEGESDEKILSKLLCLFNNEIKRMVEDNLLSFYSANSSSKVLSVVKIYEEWFVKCYAILDFDSSGREVYNKFQREYRDNVALLSCYGNKETEIEDLVPYEIIEKVVKDYIVFDKKIFGRTEKNKKMFDRLEKMFLNQGQQLTDEKKKEIKSKITEEIILMDDNTLKDKLEPNVTIYLENITKNILRHFNFVK